ncbi:MAG: MATE family efflux transporter [Bacteroidetes bacterium]|jgi:putative MATE family efflux protein|nr:MATE family efflux transporter [Bacteroidota bacterium]
MAERIARQLRKWIGHIKEALSAQEKEYTTGSIDKAIFMLSLPVVIEMMGEGLFAVVDMMYVSKLGSNAIATVGLTESVMFIVYSIAIGISMAATAVVSRRVGEKDKAAASRAAFQAIWVGVVVGLVLGGVGILFARQVLALMDAEVGVIEEGLGYTQWIFGSNVVIMLLFIINGAFRGAGDSAIAMRVLLLANGLNIVLDPILIFGLGPIPALGVKGAAIATTTGRGIAVLVQFYYLFLGKGTLQIGIKQARLHVETVLNLLKISLGGIGQFLIESASWLVLIRFISALGTQSVAGYTIGFRIIAFTLLPSWGLAQAAAALVGQNLGAKQPERAQASVWRSAYYNAGFLVIVSVMFYLASNYIVQTFFTNEPEVVRLASLTLRTVCLGYLFFAFGMVVQQAFNGAGDTYTPTIINLVVFWGLQVPLAFLLMEYFHMGLLGVLVCISLCHSIHAVVSVALFRRGRWKLRAV